MIRITQCLGSFNFDADPDPESALEKIDTSPGHEHFLKDIHICLTEERCSTIFIFYLEIRKLLIIFFLQQFIFGF